MTLEKFLRETFPKLEIEATDRMLIYLREIGVNEPRDLEYATEEDLQSSQSPFKPIEARKLLALAEKVKIADQAREKEAIHKLRIEEIEKNIELERAKFATMEMQGNIQRKQLESETALKKMEHDEKMTELNFRALVLYSEMKGIGTTVKIIKIAVPVAIASSAITWGMISTAIIHTKIH